MLYPIELGVRNAVFLGWFRRIPLAGGTLPERPTIANFTLRYPPNAGWQGRQAGVNNHPPERKVGDR